MCNFDLPQHTIPAGAQPPAALPTLYRLLSVTDAKLAAPILNMLVDTAHIGGLQWGRALGHVSGAACLCSCARFLAGRV